MAKLVILSEGFTGRVCELRADRTTIGRLEDNSCQIAEASVSSHHCEILPHGNDLLVRDLGSTNGTFINGTQIKESTLKPGQTLRLGKIELRFESDAASANATKAPAGAGRDTGRGVKMDDFDPTRKTGLGKGSPFTRKSNKTVLIFITIGVIIVLILIGVFFFASKQVGG